MRLESWRYFDYWLIGAVAILIVFSVAMINSSIAGNPELLENNTVQRQVIFALIGFVLIILITMYDYHFWSTIGRVLYVVIAIFLGLVAFGGEAAFGSARWLDVGFAVVQPSELAKITIIVVMADFFAKNLDRIGEIPWVVRSAVLTMGLVGMILIQPDLSTSITLMVIWAALLFASGLKWKHIALFILLAIVIAAVAYPFLADYQQQRITNFLFTDEEARYGEQYNVNQALVTIGSGGWLGQGYGQGTQVQLRFLKVRQSDFIYASIAHEMGFVGTVFMMALLFFVIYRVLYNAQQARDTYGALLCYGVAALIAFQTIINIGMNLKLLPVTGLPLPFISQGGSSLLSILLGIGLVESVAARQKIS
ncbi:MAG: FtsW/RodA/SpoVE family cell cycle protein [Anaerolineales bacterium]